MPPFVMMRPHALRQSGMVAWDEECSEACRGILHHWQGQGEAAGEHLNQRIRDWPYI
jgi:hypothetical protein